MLFGIIKQLRELIEFFAVAVVLFENVPNMIESQ